MLKLALLASALAHLIIFSAFRIGKGTSDFVAGENLKIQIVEKSSAPLVAKARSRKISQRDQTLSEVKATVPTQSQSPSSIGTADSLSENSYLNQLRDRIKVNQHYPPQAQARRQSGEVRVSVTVLADGELTEIRLAQESRFAKLNEAALDAVRAVHKFDPLPLSLHRERLALVVPIVFRLQN